MVEKICAEIVFMTKNETIAPGYPVMDKNEAYPSSNTSVLLWGLK